MGESRSLAVRRFLFLECLLRFKNQFVGFNRVAKEPDTRLVVANAAQHDVRVADVGHGPDVATVLIPHFIFARFYCYSYAFGKLLTLGLLDVWNERGDAFVDEYLALLIAGGSRSPAELMSELGIDLADPGFWRRGIAVVRGWLDELEALVDAG